MLLLPILFDIIEIFIVFLVPQVSLWLRWLSIPMLLISSAALVSELADMPKIYHLRGVSNAMMDGRMYHKFI